MLLLLLLLLLSYHSPLEQFKVQTSKRALPLDDFILVWVVSIFHLCLHDMCLGVMVRWKGNVLSTQGLANRRLVCHNKPDSISHWVHLEKNK